MRASRAYIASIGTTGVLVASSLMMLLLVSTLVAFRGWPAGDLANGLKSLIVDEPEPPAQLEGPASVALAAAPAAATVAPPPAGALLAAAPGTGAAGAVLGSGPLAGGGQGGGVLRDGSRTNGPNSPSPGVTPGGGAGGGQSPGLLPTTPSVPQPDVAGSLGNTTEQLTGNLGNTVSEINPNVGRTVTTTGKGVSDLLRGVGKP